MKARSQLIQSIINTISTRSGNESTENIARDLMNAIDDYKAEVIDSYRDELIKNAVKVVDLDVVTVTVINSIAKYQKQVV
jgi:hypothetical protein